jgi:hypothetical protein
VVNKLLRVVFVQECLVKMDLVEADVLKGSARVDERSLSDVGKFLNRILGLPVAKQNLIFQYFSQCMDVIIANAKREGR